MKTTLALLIPLLLAGCLTPVKEAPKRVILKSEVMIVNKEAFSSSVFSEAKIRPGVYEYSHHNFVGFYYYSKEPNVTYSSKVDALSESDGGIYISRENGKFVIWKWATLDREVPELLITGKATTRNKTEIPLGVFSKEQEKEIRIEN